MDDNKIKVCWGESRTIKGVTVAPMIRSEAWWRMNNHCIIDRLHVLKSKGCYDRVVTSLSESYIGKPYHMWLDIDPSI